jgi:hypothetical protein
MDKDEAQALLDEAEYWKQILADLQENLSDIGTLTEEVTGIAIPCAVLLSMLFSNELALNQVNEILDKIASAQITLEGMTNRLQATSSIVSGRGKMIREKMDE